MSVIVNCVLSELLNSFCHQFFCLVCSCWRKIHVRLYSTCITLQVVELIGSFNRSILLCCIQTSNSSTCIVGRQDCQISFYAKLDSKVSKAAALRAQTDNCPPQECNAWKQV
ncbi:hypothetical protein OIU77_004443 [Salix suchowensis]|uniref:Uncharacterized protein n=1 Tax=Salix suchowensis TaxID=1278906 RepID=A0ABQ9AW02_9ROSI|nr:hypothetical protein OIU77_004443 [Salix suchowensis]